jgi:peptidoglycan lytic transglycosylase G
MSGGYDEDPRQRRQAGDQRWGNDQGYGDQGYGERGRGDGGYDGDPGYRPRGSDQQGSGGYRAQGDGPQRGRGGPQRSQGNGPQRGQYGGTGGTPQYDQRQGPGPRRPQGRGRDDYDQRGDRQPPGYSEWDSGESDSSFLPGFGGREDYENGRYPRERQDREDQRRPRGDRPDGRGPGGRGPGRGDRGDRAPGGPDPRDLADPRGARPADRRPAYDDDWDERNRVPRKKVTRWFPRILVLAVVAVIVIGGSVGGLDLYHKYEARYHPADYVGAGTGDVVFQVESGDTAFSIAPRLYQMGIIASERAFTNAAENAPSTTSADSAGLEAGYYNLHLHMQASLAYAALVNPKNAIQTAVTIPEGERVSQVLTILAARTKVPLSQFEAAAKETSKLGLPPYAGTTVKLPSTVPYGQLEGYLFPATYTITPHETALQILQAMVQRYDVEAQQVSIEQAAQAAGLTPGKLIIEASMVQAEAGLDSDMPKMASVINNRQAKGMPDGFDSVVFYGLDKFGINIPDNLNPATAGPYDNTQNPGLPPTPIDNPGDAAIQAVLHPAKTDYLYFLTVATGKATEFSANCQDLPGTC